MNKKQAIKLILLIACLCYCCFKLGQGNKEVIKEIVIKEVEVEVEVNDKGFCVSCYKKHSYSDMYVLMDKYVN